MGCGGGDGEEVLGPHAGGQQGLVGIAHGGVGQQEGLVGAHGLGELIRALLQEDAAPSLRRIGCGGVTSIQ